MSAIQILYNHLQLSISKAIIEKPINMREHTMADRQHNNIYGTEQK